MPPKAPSLPTSRKVPTDALTIVLVACLILLTQQWVSVPKLWPSIPQTLRFNSVPDYVTALASLPWSSLDRSLTLALFGLFVALLIRQQQQNSATRLIAAVVSSETRTRWAVILGGFIVARYYFAFGDLTWTADAAYHTLYAWITGEAMATGTLPVWTPLVAAGTPFLQFYGFVFFYLSGVVYFPLRDIDTTLKLVLGGAHIASGITLYLLCREWTQSRRAGILAAAVYVLTFWHTQQIIVMGRYPVSLVYALLPLPFWALSLAARRRSWLKHAFCSGTCLALIVLTHPGYGIWTGFFLVLFASTLLILHVARRSRVAKASTVAVIVSLVLSSVLTVPLLLEGDETYLQSGFSLSALPDPTLSQILLWSNYNASLSGGDDATHNWYGGYVGLSAVLLSLAGLGTIIRGRAGRYPAVATWFTTGERDSR